MRFGGAETEQPILFCVGVVAQSKLICVTYKNNIVYMNNNPI